MKNIDFSPYLIMTPDELRRHQWRKGWALSMVGLIVYCGLRLFGQQPKSYKGICPYFEIGKNWGGVTMGWFFICCKNCGDSTKRHEVGHLVQSASIGGLKMLGLSIGSAIRYWWRRVFGAKMPYDSWWFEGQATYLGNQYVKLHETDSLELRQ